MFIETWLCDNKSCKRSKYLSSGEWIKRDEYAYNGISFINKKQQQSDSCYNMEESQKHHGKWS